MIHRDIHGGCVSAEFLLWNTGVGFQGGGSDEMEGDVTIKRKQEQQTRHWQREHH